MKMWVEKNKYRIWYALCFFLLGVIDQRNGSAGGRTQMVFTNLTEVAIFGMLIPSVEKEFWKWKGLKIGAVVLSVASVFACLIGDDYWGVAGQWYTAVLNVALICVGILYIVWNRKNILESRRIGWGLLCFVMAIFVMMCLSVNRSVWPWWFMGMFGCVYLIGIPRCLWRDFFSGMMLGLVTWFTVQQMLAFGFRPYDYVRYRGMYNLETPSSVFYMVAFCAFICLWIQNKKDNSGHIARWGCYFLATVCVSFLFLTSGRSALVGAVAAGIVAFMGYDIIFAKSFKHWLLQGVALGVCSLVLLPVVYGCVRYLPTILHHPIWFQGDYNEETSVRSFDPWNSERYISFDEVLYYDMGRILEMFGIRIQLEEDEIDIESPLALHVQAEEPGDSPENPFVVDAVYANQAATNSINVRKTIYVYALKHLNFKGHENGALSFWVASDEKFEGHAHNMYLQIAYSYGIVPGVLFLLWNIWCVIRLLRRKDVPGLCAAVFLVSVLGFGCTELAVKTGQITMTLLFLLYYFGMCRREEDAA